MQHRGQKTRRNSTSGDPTTSGRSLSYFSQQFLSFAVLLTVGTELRLLERNTTRLPQTGEEEKIGRYERYLQSRET